MGAAKRPAGFAALAVLVSASGNKFSPRNSLFRALEPLRKHRIARKTRKLGANEMTPNAPFATIVKSLHLGIPLEASGSGSLAQHQMPYRR
jgi:hypothetical protein